MYRAPLLLAESHYLVSQKKAEWKRKKKISYNGTVGHLLRCRRTLCFSYWDVREFRAIVISCSPIRLKSTKHVLVYSFESSKKRNEKIAERNRDTRCSHAIRAALLRLQPKWIGQINAIFKMCFVLGEHLLDFIKSQFWNRAKAKIISSSLLLWPSSFSSFVQHFVTAIGLTDYVLFSFDTLNFSGKADPLCSLSRAIRTVRSRHRFANRDATEWLCANVTHKTI